MGETLQLCSPFSSYRNAEKVAKSLTCLCNVLHTALVCHHRYLKACVQRFVIRLLFSFQIDPSRLQEPQAPAIEHTVLPLRMFACYLFICVCAMRWERKIVQRQSNTEELVQGGKLKVTVKETHEVTQKISCLNKPGHTGVLCISC